jgi:hypothetical protein
MEAIEGRYRRAPHTVRTVRISFAERACQGNETDKDSLKPAMFAMLRRRGRSAVFSIRGVTVSMRRRLWRLSLAGIIIWLSGPTVLESAAASLDQLTDLTGRASVIVTLKGRDNFTSEYRYDISVRNHSPDPLIADSLVIVLDKITNLAGEDRDPLKGESFLRLFDVLGQDGETGDGKPFFRVPVGSNQDLPPQTDSLPASVRIRNKDYLIVFTPSFRVFGQKRMPPEPRRTEATTPTPSPAPPSRNSVDKLIQLLIKKGVLTEEEWHKANQP